ncbi:hypothetical protein [Vibrio sagamiensis]|uniref:Uncharacterized protein n=1 Tax=Vibrio sagamiensis NBRC 104589 TaxID=1219064 RepID=A0A511QKA0_9VIBR|nr:hypothetical protein [Vibrio sagamiensis]GEM77753.1 hypothetical protein VSA01S_38650 [Vibrio sagamiensis NBRC 104589]
MQTRTVKVSRFQAWRMKLGLRLINLDVTDNPKVRILYGRVLQ